MKKIVMLAALAAAAYGAMKLFRGKDEDQPVDYDPQGVEQDPAVVKSQQPR
jgi:hypothetical protein